MEENITINVRPSTSRRSGAMGDVSEMILDKDEIMRYLDGEIQFKDWKQGQELLEFFSSDDNVAEASGTAMDEQEGQTDDNSSHDSDDQDDDDDEDDDDDDDDEKEGDKTEESQLDAADEEYFPPGMSVHKGKAGRPRKDKPASLTPKRPRGRPRLQGGPRSKGRKAKSSSQEDSPMAHELRLEREERRQKRKRGFPRGAPRSRVPKPLRGLMGEAHLCFARGGHQEAVMMCLEIIRQVPRCPDPYQLLAMIYEEKEDAEKSLQFSLLAAHLQPRDTEEWTRCAEMCLEQDNIQQAIRCYSKAIRYNPKELSNHMERIHLYEQLEDTRRVMDCYQALLGVLPEDQGEQYMQLAKELVKAHHKNGKISSALSILETACSTHPKFISSEDVNMLAELQITSRKYQRALQVITDHCGVVIRSKDDNDVFDMDQLSLADRENRQDLMNIHVPDGIPVDLRAKLGVCLIHCMQFQSAKDVLTLLLTKDPNDMGDLYLDVAEAYVELSCYKEARPLLEALVETQNYNLAAVWLRYAECLTSLGEVELSRHAYRQVLQRAPGHLEARIALSTIEQQQGNAEDALELLSIGAEEPSADVQLVWQRSLLLYAKGLLADFTRDGLLLLSAYVKEPLDGPEENVCKTLSGNLSMIGQEEWFGLYCKTLDALIQVGRPGEAESLSAAVISSRRLTRDPRYRLDVQVMDICIGILNSRYRRVYDDMRHILMKYPNSAAAWNIFSFVTNLTNDTRHHKFCLRLTVRTFQDNFALCLLNGNNAMVSGSFKNAVGEYVRGFRRKPDDPFLNLMIGICICHIASQKYTTKRHGLIIQGFAFLKRYEEYRGVSQETCYNIGRALHQVGLLHLALRYYHRGLDLPPSCGDPRFDLRCELAFNLSLIYQQSGNEEMAVQVLNQSVV